MKTKMSLIAHASAVLMLAFAAPTTVSGATGAVR